MTCSFVFRFNQTGNTTNDTDTDTHTLTHSHRFEEPRYIIAHFVLQFLDVPFAYEINYHEHIHMYLRDETFEAAGVPGGDPDPRFIQERRGVRREPRSPRPPTLR